ncbi:hypothetical protein H4W27_002104 [Nesterenkonia lutea]|uniref:Uncharacterized protein n=1 Tax=Nesterenkonia lutea TaxID=272919 RepID=A0ABR9JGD0_9MICC|nr:hypothetical protein [Nesterenkonia lutea]MBE1524986.1 hypothetical protein [Nesterenkonia lutea]
MGQDQSIVDGVHPGKMLDSPYGGHALDVPLDLAREDHDVVAYFDLHSIGHIDRAAQCVGHTLGDISLCRGLVCCRVQGEIVDNGRDPFDTTRSSFRSEHCGVLSDFPGEGDHAVVNPDSDPGALDLGERCDLGLNLGSNQVVGAA